MTDTILFDLDGTLLNTLEDLCDSTNYALAQFRYPPRTLDEVRNFVGEGVRLLIERALPEGAKHRTDEVLSVFSAHYDKNKENKTRPYDGVIEMLKALCPRFKTAIVSNKYDAAVRDLCDKLFPTVALAVGERAGLQRKPAPDMADYALERLHSRKENAIYVGDSDVDVRFARNSGLPIVAVSWGFRDRALLQSLGADYIVDTPEELVSLFIAKEQ